jgi:DNA-binding MarR family transcriptional regulator
VYTQKDICEKLGLPKQLVFSIIKPFWEQGYVELREAKDRRNKEVIITEKGMEYAVSILQPLEDAEANAWANFSDEELIKFVGTMSAYITAFEKNLRNLQP